MLNTHDWLLQEELDTKIVLQVHGELVFDAVQEEIECITPKTKDLMATTLLLLHSVTEVEVDTGNNWLQAHCFN